MRYLALAIPMVVAIAATSAQTPSTPPSPDGPLPSFEVASTKANKHAGSPMMGRALPGRLEMTNAPAKILLLQAYNLPTYQIEGAPAWLDSERFDIAAKAPDGAPPDQLMLMIRSLLIERF